MRQSGMLYIFVSLSVRQSGILYVLVSLSVRQSGILYGFVSMSVRQSGIVRFVPVNSLKSGEEVYLIAKGLPIRCCYEKIA